MRTDLLQLSPLSLAELLDNNSELIRLCNLRRSSLPTSPVQSNFRVFAFLIIRKDDSEIDIIEGANSEPTYIGGSICAERAAIMQLRHFNNPTLLKVVVVTDSKDPVSPGVLCREYLSSFASMFTEIVIGNCDGSTIVEVTLSELFPWPSIYRSVTSRLELATFGSQFAATKLCQPCTTTAATDIDMVIADEVLRAALSVNVREKLSCLHPISYSAAVRLTDGRMLTAWQLKTLEYGSDLDPISQLAADLIRLQQSLLQSSASSGIELHSCYLAMVDQFGIAHAPVARARALLTEHGLGDVVVLIHSPEDGQLIMRPAKELLPSPKGSSLLTHDDFS